MPELPILMILESDFPSQGGGGAESQVRTLAIELIDRGHPVQVVTPMVIEGPQREFDQVESIPVTRIPYPRVRWFGAAVLLFKLAWLLIVRRRQYQVVHVHIAGNMAAVACLMGQLLGRPVLVKLTGMTEMRGGILDPRAGLGARVRRWALRHASAYQATSRRLAAMLDDVGFSPSKILNLPNAVDTLRFAADRTTARTRREVLVGDRRIVGIFAGRLEPEKDLDLLIAAWSEAFAGRKDMALMVVGGGSQYEFLRQQARQLGVDSQVVFVGPQERVEDFHRMADFGLLTSRYEGLSNALLEYMAAGLPVVGSRVSGTEDWVIEGRTGWLFSAGDRVGLAQALRAVADGGLPELRRRGREAQEQIEHSASIGAVVQALQTTYLGLERGSA